MSQYDVKQLMNRALNLPIWQAQKGTGSFITFEMGEKAMLANKDGTPYLRGSVHLWIYLCDWEIRRQGKILAKSDGSDDEIASAVNNFEAQHFCSIEKIDVNTLEVKASNDLSIVLFGNDRAYEKNDDFFTLYVPEACVSYNKTQGFYAEPRGTA